MPRFPDCKKIFPFRFALLSPPPPNSARCEEERGEGRKRDSGIAGEDYFFFLRSPFLLRRRRFSENGVMGGGLQFFPAVNCPLFHLSQHLRKARRREGRATAFLHKKEGKREEEPLARQLKERRELEEEKGLLRSGRCAYPSPFPLPFFPGPISQTPLIY